MDEMRRYRAVLFDVDGTLLDTSEGLYASAKKAIREMGLPPLDADRLRKILSANAQHAFQEYYQLSEEDTRRISDIYRSAYRDEFFSLVEPFPGVPRMLEELRADGYVLGTASLKREDFCRTLFGPMGLLDYFDVLSGQSADYTRTKRDTIVSAAERLGLEASDCVLVGDSVYDAEGAEQAGCGFLAVTYGFGFTSAEEVAPYPLLASAANTGEVLELLRS